MSKVFISVDALFDKDNGILPKSIIWEDATVVVNRYFEIIFTEFIPSIISLTKLFIMKANYLGVVCDYII